jgi:hypothetical protein
VQATRIQSIFCCLKTVVFVIEVTADCIIVIDFLLLVPEALRNKFTPQVKVKVAP